MNKIVGALISGLIILGFSQKSNAQTFQGTENNTWEFRLSITNVGTLGNPSVRNPDSGSVRYYCRTE